MSRAAAPISLSSMVHAARSRLHSCVHAVGSDSGHAHTGSDPTSHRVNRSGRNSCAAERQQRRSLHAADYRDGEEDGADAKLQKLLDTPLIDPTQDNADDPEFLRRFKQLVNDDYNFAEALYAGGVFAVLLFFSQQGVSVYKHCVAMPDAACPWASGSVDAFSNFPT